MFAELAADVKKPAPRERRQNEWIWPATWALIDTRAMLRRKCRLCQTGSRRMARHIQASLKEDRAARTARVAKTIESELTAGRVEKAFHHLKSWYRDASATTARPCYMSLEKQTADMEALYRADPPDGPEVAINVEPYDVRDEPPGDGELRSSVWTLSNGRAAGTSFMRAEHIKRWLRGAEEEEDPETPEA
jgi:hypothetical protein